jgi:hypothetical protein
MADRHGYVRQLRVVAVDPSRSDARAAVLELQADRLRLENARERGELVLKSEVLLAPRRLAATGATAHDRPSEAGHPENPPV